MKVIKEVITQSVTTISLKRNLIPRFTKGGGAQKNDAEQLDVENKGMEHRDH
jgi:hypothetical protein